MIDYLTVFVTVVVINVVPFLMPPTWLVLGFFYKNFTFDPLTLALVGAVASTTGRFMLTYIGSFSRRFMGKQRKKDMDFIGRAAAVHPVKSFFVTLLMALSPFPSNVYFLGVGITKARRVAVFAGFFIGRLISYYVLIRVTGVFFTSISDMFADTLTQIIVIDAIGVVFMLLFIAVDWKTLIKERKLKFIPIRLRKS